MQKQNFERYKVTADINKNCAVRLSKSCALNFIVNDLLLIN